MAFFSKSTLLLGALIIAYLLPIWLFPYFPTQDGVSHVYNSQILTEYRNPDYEFRAYYEINWYPFPNWLSHFALAMLMFVFPPLIAEKVFLSLYVILFPLAMRYFLNAAHRYKPETLRRDTLQNVSAKFGQSNPLTKEPGRQSLVILSFTFIYNYLLLMGFYNFAVSVPLFFLTLGYWYRHRDAISLKRAVLLNLLIVITYFAHLISYAFLLFAIALLSVLHFKRNLPQIFRTGLSILPAALLLLVYLPTSDLVAGEPPEFGLNRLGELLDNLLGLKVLIAFNEAQALISYAVSALLIFLAVWTLWQNRRTSRPRRTRGRRARIAEGSPRHAEDFHEDRGFARDRPSRYGVPDESVGDRGFARDRPSRYGMNAPRAFLILSGVLFGLYLILPNSIGPGGWVNDRLAILATLTLFAWFRESDKPRWRQVFTGIVTLLAVINVLYIGVLCKNLNAELREFNAFVGKIEKNKVILPLHFEPRGSSLKVGIFVNAANYYCLDNGGINLGNYEVQFDYFPVRFNADFETPIQEKEWVQIVHWQPEKIDLCAYADNVDYLLLWGTPNEPTAAPVEREFLPRDAPIASKIASEIEACYTLIASEGKLKLFRGNR